MLTKIIIAFGFIIAIVIMLAVSFGSSDSNNRKVRIYCYMILVLATMAVSYECYNIMKLRNCAKELCLCYLITKDEADNRHYPRVKALYVHKESDSIYSVYNKGKRLVLDSIYYLGVRHIGVSDIDTFDLIEYITPNGDTMLYDAYLDKSISFGQFEPHYDEPIYWDFNYSNL